MKQGRGILSTVQYTQHLRTLLLFYKNKLHHDQVGATFAAEI